MDWTLVERRLDAYERLLRLHQPIGTLLLLWPTLWALWLAAGGMPPVDVLAIFCVGTLLMRSAGCAVNDVFDRRFDAHVQRTRARPLAAGEIRPAEALVLAGLLAAAAFGLVLMLNRLTLVLSFIALGIAVTYPLTKRFFALPQLYLGVAFGFGIPMAYAALQNRLPAQCWVLLAANVGYAFAYDTEYAMVDREDDAKIGMRTSALTLGRYDVAGVMAGYAGMLLLLVAAGVMRKLSWPYYAGLALALALMGYHFHLIRGRSREGCFKAFRHNNWVGAAVFGGIVAAYALG